MSFKPEKVRYKSFTMIILSTQCFMPIGLKKIEKKGFESSYNWDPNRYSQLEGDYIRFPSSLLTFLHTH